MSLSLVDSSGWIEYFMNGPLAEPYEKYLSKSREVITPTLVLFEVYKKIKNELDEEQALLAAAQMEKTNLIPLSAAIAYRAADVSLEYKLALADSVIYATADIQGARLITSDADFKNLPKVLYLEP